jgi:hypothetical protein
MTRFRIGVMLWLLVRLAMPTEVLAQAGVGHGVSHAIRLARTQ